jgi:hypothetical protein
MSGTLAMLAFNGVEVGRMTKGSSAARPHELTYRV